MSSKYQKKTINCFFPNQIEPDPENKEEFKAYWKKEKDRCINGFYLGNGQVYISGWLYWHCVYWIIEIDIEYINPVTGKKSSSKGKGTPYLRDLEWEFSIDLERCEREKKIYLIVGCRGLGKSFWAASFLGQTYTFIPDSECLITAGGTSDISKLAEKVELGLSSLHPVFQKQRLKDNWKQEVRAGWKDNKTGLSKGSNSRILARNYSDGNNSMATNGTRPLRQVIDEIGKLEGLKKCVADSMPSWMNDYGFFATPLLCGTGGDFDKGEDAGKLFNDPIPANILEFDDIWEGKGKIGKFIPATKGRNEFKEDWTLYKFLKEKYPEKYGNLQPHPELDIIIKVSDEEKCMREFVEPRRLKLSKSTSGNDLISEKAYYPIVPTECFLKLSSNDFPVEAIQEHKSNLESSHFKPSYVELYEDLNGIIRHKFSNKTPVREFPVKPTTNKEGVIEIVEFPVEGSSWGTYISSMDPYKVGESDYSTSLGAIYIWKRMTVDMSEPYQYMPVAWYVGRPSDIREWQETALKLIEFYQAECMSESNDESFIQYVIGKNKQYLLAKGQTALKEINPTTKYKGQYGQPATPKTIEFWNNSAIIYLKEKFSTQTTMDGVKKELLGVHKVLDVMLLEELLKFDKYNKKGNYDRLRAWSIGLAYVNQLDASMGQTNLEYVPKSTQKLIKSPFGLNKLGGDFKNNHRSFSSPFNLGKLKNNF